jgi:hypothetical protein
VCKVRRMASKAPAERARAAASTKGLRKGRFPERLPMDRGCPGQEGGRFHGRLGDALGCPSPGDAHCFHHFAYCRRSDPDHTDRDHRDGTDLLPDRVTNLEKYARKGVFGILRRQLLHYLKDSVEALVAAFAATMQEEPVPVPASFASSSEPPLQPQPRSPPPQSPGWP